MSNRVTIAGSDRQASTNPAGAESPAPQTRLEASIIIRRPPTQVSTGESKNAARSLSALPGDLKAVVEFAHEAGLHVIEESAERRTVVVSGTVTQFEAAFGTKLKVYRQGNQNQPYISYDGALSVPGKLGSIVTAVMGLDQRPIATPHTP